jgi:hypothetical protein
MNGHDEDWQLALQTLFQMPFLFILDRKARSLCCKKKNSTLKICLNLPYYIVPTKTIFTQQKIIAGMSKLYMRLKVLSPVLSLLINIVSFLQLFMQVHLLQ